MKTTRRLAVLLLALTMVLSLTPFQALAQGEDVALDAVNFPDPVFREYVSQFDTDGDGVLALSERQTTTIDLSYNGTVTSMEGIAFFPNLKVLNCGVNLVSRLDLTGCVNLTEVNCECNRLDTLILGDAAPTKLYLSTNRLTSLDLDYVPSKLEAGDQYRAVSAPEGVFDLAELEGFDITKASGWQGATVSGTVLTFQAGSNWASYTYDCGQGVSLEFHLVRDSGEAVALTEANFPDAYFRSFVAEYDEDGDDFLALEERLVQELTYSLYFFDREDLEPCATVEGLEFFPELRSAYLAQNQITDLDISGNPAMFYLNCDDNPLETLTLGNLPNLDWLYCGGTNLTELDLSQCPALTRLMCDDSQFVELDLRSQPMLDRLSCGNNQLKTLNLSECTLLTDLYCPDNLLEALDLSANTALSSLFCGNNRLVALDVSNCNLRTFYCDGNTRQIPLTDGSYDLAKLSGFDIAKASGWQGGDLDGTVLTFQDGAEAVTYTYDCGQGRTATFTLTAGKPEQYVNFSAYTCSLGGNIAMNFYVELSQDLVEDPDAVIRFTFAGQTREVPLSQGLEDEKNGVTRYRYSCPITSKNMTDPITAQVYVDGVAVGGSKTMDVETYCQYMIANSTDAKTVDLMKAMLNYGASAQKLFTYRTDDLANASLTGADKVLSAVDASAYAHSRTGTETGISAKSYTLLLDSETTVRVYFTLDGTKTIDQFTFTVDGVKVMPQESDKGWYIECKDIRAQDLDQIHVFTCGGITIRYGGLSYVNQAMTYYSSGNIFEMASALHAYWQAAEAYIN